MAKQFNFSLAMLCIAASVVTAHPGQSRNTKNAFAFINRSQWGAAPPRSVTRLSTPAPMVIIHHTAVPGPCFSRDQCSQSMRSVQNTHMNVNDWVDIGYNFAVGGDGAVYEGRGWLNVGAHATGYNTQSIGIVFIGNFVSTTPPVAQTNAAKNLIALGVSLGFIRRDYRLIGHRQVSATECPGQRLFSDIQTWDRFSNIV